VAEIDAEGRVRLVGRSSDLVITGGYNVYPKEIELLIDDLPGVEEAAVIGVPHPDFGEAVLALVVPKQTPLNPDEISEALRPILAPFKRPKEVILLDELPRNAMGKVEKAALRTRYVNLFTRV
jgi:malonyl-CoA/methylmalonyl-CoA synthetase